MTTSTVFISHSHKDETRSLLSAYAAHGSDVDAGLRACS